VLLWKYLQFQDLTVGPNQLLECLTELLQVETKDIDSKIEAFDILKDSQMIRFGYLVFR
jgi:hypothetical protein